MNAEPNMTAQQTQKPEDKCYACDARASGWTCHEGAAGGKLVRACARHQQKSDQEVSRCVYCGTATRKGSLSLDHDDQGFPQYAHHKCHKDACC